MPWTWERECQHYHRRVLTGKKKHRCPDWDELPIDETCDEILVCTCFENINEDPSDLDGGSQPTSPAAASPGRQPGT